MEKITDLQHFTSAKPTVVTIGMFDGVHLGHQKILKKLTTSATEKGWLSTVLTFFPHPRTVLQQDQNLKLIHTLEEKIQMLENCGIEQLIIHPFDTNFAQLDAEIFVKTILVDKLRAQKVIIGYDHRFGKGRTANIEDLKDFGKKYNFEVEEISAAEIDQVSISSTKIRKALEMGDVEKAKAYIGSPYLLTGTVVHGMKIGRTLGYPTANIQIEESYKLIPKEGVYIVYALINQQKTYGMMSIGNNPTIPNKGKSIEVYFFDFNKDLYNQKIQLYLLKRIRDEQRFESLPDLKAQIRSDEQFALNYIDSKEIKH